jgi:hypothetical protein
MTYAYAGDFETTVSASSFYGAVANLGADHSTRLSDYNLYYDYYTGTQWDNAIPEGFEQITVNYVESFVSKIKRFTFRNGWNMSFPEEMKTAGVADWLTNCWKYNKKDKLTRILTEYAGIFGDWYVYAQWIPGPNGLGKNSFKNLRLTTVDPRYVYPEYNEITGEMEFCTIIVPYTKKQLINGSMRYSYMLHKETHTKNTIYVQESNDKGQEVMFEQLENPLGKVLVVHGKNLEIGGSNFGKSDVKALIEMQKLMNEKISDVSEIIAYHAAPVTVIKGARTRQLEKGANKIWAGIPVNGDVYNLKSEANIDSSMNFVGWLKKAMHELGQLPEDALGGKREISNTSAVALSLDYEPLIELADEKRFYFEEGIKELNKLMIDLSVNRGALPQKTLVDIDSVEEDIEFGALLPRDRTEDLEELEVELRLGLETKRGALVRLNCKNVEEKLKELEEYEEELQEKAVQKQEQMIEAQMKTAGLDSPGFVKKPDGKDEVVKDPNPAAQNAVNKSRVVHGEQVVRQQVRAKS